MGPASSERSLWIARTILPLEPALRSWLRRYPNTGIEIDDVVQETYAVFGSMESVSHIRAPRNYMFQTAHSIVMAHVRRSKIVQIDYVAELDHLGAAVDLPSPETQVLDREELRRLGALMLALPPQQREAFSLLKIEGMSQREAASAMGVAESTLEKHVAKAVRFMMDRLGRGGKSIAQASGDRTTDELGERGTSRNERRD